MEASSVVDHVMCKSRLFEELSIFSCPRLDFFFPQAFLSFHVIHKHLKLCCGSRNTNTVVRRYVPGGSSRTIDLLLTDYSKMPPSHFGKVYIHHSVNS